MRLYVWLAIKLPSFHGKVVLLATARDITQVGELWERHGLGSPDNIPPYYVEYRLADNEEPGITLLAGIEGPVLIGQMRSA